MVTSQTEIESRAVELSAEAFEAFCEDISGMFGVDMECSWQRAVTETVNGLKKRFKKKLVAINLVKAEGALNGTFQLIFDQGGLFTLSGVIVMLPENRILEEIKRGTIKDVETMNDALKEAGNLMVGSWDRIFREELEGHGHFAQTNTFIGKPWDKPEETIGLAGDEEFIFVPYEMTIGSYPAFKCGAIFPKAIFDDTAESNTDQPCPAEQSTEEETEQEAKEEAKEKAEQETKEEPQAPAEEKTEEKIEEKAEEKADEKAQDQSSAEEKAGDEGTVKEEPQADGEEKSDDIDADAADNAVEEKAATTDGNKGQPVSETIQKMTESSAGLPGEHAFVSSTICAKDIMEKNVVWGSPEDSVQQVIAKMQQHDIGYLMVGADGVLEGIVSKSDITGATSCYLRPIFAKWRRPLDDATLQIKVKWIMNRPVRTIKPGTSLTAIIENMRRFGGRCLPVVDQQDKVQGLVTVFDIFKVLNSNPE